MSNTIRRMVPPSRPESGFRKPTFLGGLWVRLADDQEWALPGPRELGEAGPDRDEVAAILRAIGMAEDKAECRRGELALAIKLLSINYDLTPETFQAILEHGADKPAPSSLQDVFHDLACRHAEAIWPREASREAPQGRRLRFPALWSRRQTDRKKQAC